MDKVTTDRFSIQTSPNFSSRNFGGDVWGKESELLAAALRYRYTDISKLFL